MLKILGALCIAMVLTMGAWSAVDACTRAVFQGAGDTVVTGRTLDWAEDASTDMWIFPRGLSRDGAPGAEKNVTWTSKYGSVSFSFYGAAIIDGMNEKGLVANALYLAEADYGQVDDRPVLSVMALNQYVLDNYATVAEAVRGMESDEIRISAPILPDGSPASAHLSLSDPTGDSAIFEYLDGRLVIHHDARYVVMTNSPRFEEQLAIQKYWNTVGGVNFLPGSINSADRFVRTGFLLAALPRDAQPRIITAVPGQSVHMQHVASVLSLMRAVSVPLGVADPDKPNIASTFWRTVYDHQRLIAAYDSATSPNAFWLDLGDVDFAETAKPKMLSLAAGKVYAGNVAHLFEPAEPFAFPAVSH